MGGPLLAGDNPHKIKGGRWTVFRFFLVSTAYTSVWLAVSSQLGSYRELFGPQVLLQLNIAYFLPSIPLLVVSGLFDKALEARLGVARTVLIRLLVGLVGYGAVCAWFPFQPVDIWYLLWSVVALGLFSGIAFSASYQLVARFANKNVIALGLGCSASGPLVLLLQLVYGVGEEPGRRELIWMYETIAVIVVAGLWATTSLLFRHWDAIESYESKQQQQQLQAPLEEPLLRQEEASEQQAQQPLSPGSSRAPPGSEVPLSPIRHPSLPPLIAYSSLEPYQTHLTADDEYAESFYDAQSWVQGTSWSQDSLLGNSDDGFNPSLHRQHSGPGILLSGSPGAALSSSPPAGQRGGQHGAAGTAGGAPAADVRGPGVAPAGLSVPAGTPFALRGRVSFNSRVSNLETGSPHEIPPTPKTPAPAPAAVQGPSMRQLAVAALREIWPALSALALSCTISLVLFPFFTYVPTSGLLGESLPKTLFFVRIFADVFGRFLPRLHFLAVQNPFAILVVALFKLACVPLYFLYLKSPERFHSDVLAVVFIAVVWTIGGYVNTMGNLVAPRLVAPHLKPTAAGLMAIAYQTAHFLGLVIATVAAVLLFGHIGVQ